MLGSSFAFMSLSSLTSFDGAVKILSPTATSHGSNAQTLTASVDAKSTSINFSVLIDFCSSTVF